MASPAPVALPDPPKKKRGRPRKYARPDDGPLPLGVVIATPAAVKPVTPKTENVSTEKRGRGRPPGSGKKNNPFLPTKPDQVGSPAKTPKSPKAPKSGAAGKGGGSFTPRIITVPIGEDVAGKIMGFSQQGPRAVCVLSANGSISSVTLRHDSSFGGNTTYEGKYEILSLSGSYLFSDTGGTRSRSGGLSVSLAAADGKVVGGSVSGLLVAASPVQIVVGSFTPDG